MTNDERLKQLKLMRVEPLLITAKKHHELIDDLIEHFTPKKVERVKLRRSEYGSSYRCANCEADLIKVEFMSFDGGESNNRTSYCWHCGQAIDWSEENEDYIY